MPNYIHKETGDLKRFPSVRIQWDEDGVKKEIDLSTMDNILDNYIPEEIAGDWNNVKMAKAVNDGYGIRR
tara:strand:- start:106 stop:315 length:210 start_codon:yes stop_codon:yes gene_type:complete